MLIFPETLTILQEDPPISVAAGLSKALHAWVILEIFSNKLLF